MIVELTIDDTYRTLCQVTEIGEKVWAYCDSRGRLPESIKVSTVPEKGEDDGEARPHRN